MGRPAVLPSLLLCDFGNLEREIIRLEEAGVEALHLDVMDGHVVTNLSYAMPIVAAIRRLTKLPLDVHLMISNPEQFAMQFVEAGADAITFHREASKSPAELLAKLKSEGVCAGMAFNPLTSLEESRSLIEDCDLVLVMSVEAGFGGQAFNSNALDRLKWLRQQLGDGFLLEVDGGVNTRTIGQCVEAGADLLVVGSAIFKQPDYCEAMSRLADAMQPTV